MASEELYFRRADLYTDDSEGLPTEDYAQRVLGLNPYDVRDRVSLNNHLGSLAQHREAYYISCWHLYREETLGMWDQYGHDGVAVCARYELLKAALDGLLDEIARWPRAVRNRSFGGQVQIGRRRSEKPTRSGGLRIYGNPLQGTSATRQTSCRPCAATSRNPSVPPCGSRPHFS